MDQIAVLIAWYDFLSNYTAKFDLRILIVMERGINWLAVYL